MVPLFFDFQLRLRQHHDECFDRYNTAEEERRIPEKQHTMMLLKRAELMRQLQELDSVSI